MPQHWYTGPWIWDATLVGGCWRPPAGLAGLDLRPVPQQSVQGGTPGVGLFFGAVAPAQLENRSDYTHLGGGSWYDLKPTAKQRAAILARKGYVPHGDDLVGIVLDLLTQGADPDGLDGPKPLVPTAGGRLSLHCGQSHHERFRWGSFHTSVLRQTLRKDFTAVWHTDPTRARKVLDDLCLKYGVDDWREFVPPALQADVPGRLPRETTLTDDFNRANQTGLGTASGGFTYTALEGSYNIVSNAAVSASSGSNCFARADADLSSADHYAQASLASDNTNTSAVVCRKDSSATLTLYYFDRNAGSSPADWRIFKRVAGSFTSLATSSNAFAVGDVLKGSASGSSLAVYQNGVQRATATDTAISTGLRCGFHAFDAGIAQMWDDFTAADIGGGGGGVIYTQLERGLRGYARGTFEGSL